MIFQTFVQKQKVALVLRLKPLCWNEMIFETTRPFPSITDFRTIKHINKERNENLVLERKEPSTPQKILCSSDSKENAVIV